MLLDYSVGTGDWTGLCQVGSVIGFRVPTANHLFPRILTLFAFVSATSSAPPFPFFGFFTRFSEKGLGMALGTHGGTSAAGRPASPLPPHPWLVAVPPSSCQGVQFLAFVYGTGEGSTSLAPHLPLEAQAVLGLGTVYLICMHAARCGGDRKGPSLLDVASRPLLVAVREAVERASVVRAHAEMPLSVSV